jgi:hypothetical protein
MGGIRKESLQGVKLEFGIKENTVLYAFFFSFWFTAYIDFQQKDEKVKSAAINAAVCQWLTIPSA